jgi:thymidylate synthase
MNIPTYRTIGEAWLNVCQRCMADGRKYEIQRGSYIGQRRKQLDMLSFAISSPGERPLAVEYRGTPISDDESITRYFEDYLINPALADNEQYTYASRLNLQIYEVAAMLRGSPNTNQAIAEVGQPSDINLADPPCLRLLSWKSTPQGLQLTSFWRSWDLYGALAMNLGGLQLLNEFMAEWAGLEAGSLVCYSDGAHIYEQSWAVAPGGEV